MKTLMSGDIFKACRILFGPEIDLSLEFLYYIQSTGIKSAYRKKAMETHPDLASGSGQHDTTTFIDTHWAYKRLVEFIRLRDAHPGRRLHPMRVPGSVAQPRRHRPRRRTRKGAPGSPGEGQPAGYYYKSAMPRRRLMLGEYLFYGGHVSWEALIKAIVWQRKQRPRFGDMAVKGGLLSEENVLHGSRLRRLGEPIGQSLRRLGMLTERQLDMLIMKQRALQSPIGEFFVINGYMTAARLNGHIEGHRKYNEKHS